MDGFVLRCNSLRCRASLSEQGVVTTCSHLYCVDCARTLFDRERVCPACGTRLPEPDDVVLTNLNPTDDYKTSVLSGLAPSVIMEICARALSFWTYQSTQEIIYQEYMSKTLQDKYNEINTQMDNVVREANAEIGTLRDKISTLQSEQQALARKNHELTESLQAKNRQYHKLQDSHDRMKRKSLISPIQNGAAQNIDVAIGTNDSAAATSISNRAPMLNVRSTDWRQSQPPPISSGQRIMLDTSKHATIPRRQPLEALHTGSHSQSFMSTPRNARTTPAHSVCGPSVVRSTFQGRGF